MTENCARPMCGHPEEAHVEVEGIGWVCSIGYVGDDTIRLDCRCDGFVPKGDGSEHP